MHAFHWWFIIAFVLVVLEIFTTGFFVFCFAIGCILAAGVSLCGGGIILQIWALIIGAVVSFLSVRPFMLKILRRKEGVLRTNVDAIISREAMVIEKIDQETGSGRVKIDGDIWKAISEDGHTIEVGKKVIVTKHDSIILTVKIV